MIRTRSERLILAALTAAVLLQPGCRTVPVAPPPPPPIARPAFEKTFGEAVTDGAALSVKYKDMRLLVDPSPAMQAANGAAADFILFTRAAAIAGPYRTGQKAIGPDDAAAGARAAALAFKALTSGQRIMLSKGPAFAFVSAVRSRGAGGEALNGYLLEFDNGRNLVVLPAVADLSPVREFVYGLRDDGKAIYAGFFPQFPNAAAGAETAGLIQPQFAVFTGAPALDKAQLTDALGANMFAGESHQAPGRDTVPF